MATEQELHDVFRIDSRPTTMMLTARLELGISRDFRCAADELNTPSLTAMGYRSMADQSAEPPRPGTADRSERLLLTAYHPAMFAARCLVFGIGPDCSSVVNALTSASWFAHLHETAIGPHCLFGQAGQRGNGILQLLGGLPPHFASIALSLEPTSAEVDLAFELGHLLRHEYGTFVVMTSALADPEMSARLGQACDCFVKGDGGLAHHHYPVRTVSEPASGRLICYDLYDACCLWAGRFGEYGVFRTAADALHVEVSAPVMTLREVDELAAGFRKRLRDPGNLKLFTVVGGADLADATPISFSRSVLIRQDRAPELA